MPRVKYIGFKKKFGPLKKKWMTEPLAFTKKISDEIDADTARAIVDSMPALFEYYEGAPPVKVKRTPAKRKTTKRTTTRRRKTT